MKKISVMKKNNYPFILLEEETFDILYFCIVVNFFSHVAVFTRKEKKLLKNLKNSPFFILYVKQSYKINRAFISTKLLLFFIAEFLGLCCFAGIHMRCAIPYKSKYRLGCE